MQSNFLFSNLVQDLKHINPNLKAQVLTSINEKMLTQIIDRKMQVIDVLSKISSIDDIGINQLLSDFINSSKNAKMIIGQKSLNQLDQGSKISVLSSALREHKVCSITGNETQMILTDIFKTINSKLGIDLVQNIYDELNRTAVSKSKIKDTPPIACAIIESLAHTKIKAPGSYSAENSIVVSELRKDIKRAIEEASLREKTEPNFVGPIV